ncbi:hypothetical protein GYA49_00685 [Candidatus Beckwithbacteria bacterium]|nr:hypothetical protein [Candidatus Beckwithbacteria bacterium]
MNTKQLFTYLGVTVVLIALLFGGYFVYQKGLLTFQKDPTITPKKVKITNVSHDRFTVSWLTDAATKGSIAYGSKGKLDQVQLDDNDQLTGQAQDYKVHHATITGLQPATTYNFEIKSGEKLISFNDNGEAYSVKTAPTLGSQPPTDLINGTVSLESGAPASGSIVYVTIPGVTPLSTQVKKDGSWLISLANARTTKLTEYAQYDPETTIIDIMVQGDGKTSNVTTNTANDSPVPAITLGQTYDFTALAQAEPEPMPSTIDEEVQDFPTDEILATDEETTEPEALPIEPDEEATDSGEMPETYAQELEQNPLESIPVSITNPADDGEELNTTQPDFFGEGPANKVLTIQIDSGTTTATAVVDSEGTWSYSPNSNLAEGSHTLTIDYTDSNGDNQTLNRSFVIATAGVGGDDLPAFEATPSATSVTRSSMPSTESGTPTSGFSLPTYGILLLGFVLLTTGFYAKVINKA